MFEMNKHCGILFEKCNEIFVVLFYYAHQKNILKRPPGTYLRNFQRGLQPLTHRST